MTRQEQHQFRADFNWVYKVSRNCLEFTLFSSVIGPEISTNLWIKMCTRTKWPRHHPCLSCIKWIRVLLIPLDGMLIKRRQPHPLAFLKDSLETRQYVIILLGPVIQRADNAIQRKPYQTDNAFPRITLSNGLIAIRRITDSKTYRAIHRIEIYLMDCAMQASRPGWKEAMWNCLAQEHKTMTQPGARTWNSLQSCFIQHWARAEIKEISRVSIIHTESR